MSANVWLPVYQRVIGTSVPTVSVNPQVEGSSDGSIVAVLLPWKFWVYKLQPMVWLPSNLYFQPMLCCLEVHLGSNAHSEVQSEAWPFRSPLFAQDLCCRVILGNERQSFMQFFSHSYCQGLLVFFSLIMNNAIGPLDLVLHVTRTEWIIGK